MKRISLAIPLILALAVPSWAGTVTPAVSDAAKNSQQFTRKITWTSLTAANASGTATNTSPFRMIEVQIKGTWNTGTLTIQGSDDGTNYGTLTQLKDLADASYTSDPAKPSIPLLECPLWVKPVLSGAGTDDVTVTLVGRD